MGSKTQSKPADDDERIRFRKPPLDIRTTYSELEQAVWSLLTAVFRAQDEKGGQELRDKELAVETKRLREHGIGYGLKELYVELIELE